MRIFQLKNKMQQIGQGMSEYLIIVGLIAVVGVSVVGFLGGAINFQLASIAQEISGGDGTNANASAATSAGNAESGATARDLSNYYQ